MLHRVLILILMIGLWFSLTAQLCTKELVYGRDFYTDPIHETFPNGKGSVMAAVQKTLDKMGYETQVVDESKGEYITGWKPVAVDSHYFNLFDRRDYGAADGAYYQLVVSLSDVGSRVKVGVGTKVKTIVGKLKSTDRVERKVLAQLRDYLRSPVIELTNVGVKQK